MNKDYRFVGFLGLLTVASFGCGLVLNQLRCHPLPYEYITKQGRLDAAVAKIGVPVAGVAVKQIGILELRKIVESKTAIILDARRNIHWRNGHIPGAYNLSQDAFESDYANLKSLLEAHKDRQIIVYCWGEMCEDSQFVAHALAKLGYQNVSIFPGGWMDWTQNGLPTEIEKE